MQTTTLPFEEKGKKIEYVSIKRGYYQFETKQIVFGTNGSRRLENVVVALKVAEPDDGNFTEQELAELVEQGFKKAHHGWLLYAGGYVCSSECTVIDHERRYI